jgi:peptide/nickel transport system permease protein
MGISEPVWDVAASLSLLLTGVVILTFGDVLLVTCAAMDDVMLEDYVMVARAKGLPEKAVRDKHAARTAILPVLSRFTVSIPYFLTGLVILEAVFSGTGVAGIGALQRVQGPQGLGSLLFEAVADQDTPMIIGSLLVVGVLTLLLRIALDIVHAYLDPRIRFGNANGG